MGIVASDLQLVLDCETVSRLTVYVLNIVTKDVKLEAHCAHGPAENGVSMRKPWRGPTIHHRLRVVSSTCFSKISPSAARTGPGGLRMT